MRRALQISPFVAGILCLALSLTAQADPLTVSETLAQMSLQQKVGQVFIWTYPGQALSKSGEEWLTKFQPGALIVFSRNIKNPEQIGRFNSDLQKFAQKKMKAPFFLMIDQEGGTVTRLHTSTPLPSALALGKIEDASFTRSFGEAVASVLKGVGFNVNLAPVLDISDPTKNTFIGNRTFGDDPDAVAERAGAYAQGISDGGMIPTAKHFPGHGGVAQDSHQMMPKKLASYEELAEKDLVPFEEYAQVEYPRAVMMAHLALPNVDPSGQPATYSKILIQDYLRDKLKFDGLIITDDLEMSGASEGQDIGDRAIHAFLAGNDMLMLTGSANHQRQAYLKFLAAVKSGKISEARLQASLEKIIGYKKTLGLGQFVFDAKQNRTQIIALETLSRQVLHQSFQHALKAQPLAWPTVRAETRALVLGSDTQFFKSFQKTFVGKSKFYQLTPKSLAQAAHALETEKYDIAIFYASGAQTARWLTTLKSNLRSKIIVVNANEDGEVESQGSYLNVLNVGTNYPDGGGELADSLAHPDVRAPAQTNP